MAGQKPPIIELLFLSKGFAEGEQRILQTPTSPKKTERCAGQKRRSPDTHARVFRLKVGLVKKYDLKRLFRVNRLSLRPK